MLLFLFVLLCVLCTPLNAQQYSFFSGVSSEKTADSGMQIRLPVVEARIFGLSDFSTTESKKIAVKNWSIQAGDSDTWQVSAGNISLSGVFSRFNNPASTVPSAFKSFGVTETGLAVSKPSFSSSRVSTASFASSVRLNSFDFFVFSRFDRGLEIEQVKTVSFPLGMGASYTYPQPELRRGAPFEFSVLLFAGHTVHKSKESDSWYLDYPYFAQTSAHYLISEISVFTPNVELFSSNGLSEHPLGQVLFFTRNEVSWNLSFFTLNIFFSYIDNGYIPANGNPIHKSVHSYLNPQVFFPVNKEKTRHLRIGLLASAQYEHTNIRHSLPLLTSDIKTSLAFFGHFFSVHTDYELKDIEPLQEILFSEDSLFKTKVSLSFKNAPIKPSVYASLGARYEMYPHYYIMPEQECKKSLYVDLSASFSPLHALYFHGDAEIEIKEAEPIPSIEVEIEYSMREDNSIWEVSLSAERTAKKEYGIEIKSIFHLL